MQPGAVEQSQLVERAGGIEQPDGMPMPVLVLVGERAVAADTVPDGPGVAVAGIDPRFLDAFRVAGVVVPVVGIIADGHDGLATRDLPDCGGHRGSPPLLRGDRSRRAVVRVLVICHHEDFVREGSKGPKIPVGGDRNSDRDEPSVPGKP